MFHRARLFNSIKLYLQVSSFSGRNCLQTHKGKSVRKASIKKNETDELKVANFVAI